MSRRVHCTWLLIVVASAVLGLLHGGAGIAVAATEHGPATPGREGAATRYLAYAPAAPSPAAICMIDTGVDSNPDTATALLHSEAILPGQAPSGDTDLAHKHGTKTLGVAVAPRNGWGTIGIWPQLRAVSINGTRPDRATFPFDSYRLGIKRCDVLADIFPIRAINLSLGSTEAPTPSEVLLLKDAIARARSNGIHVVGAAGNLGGAVETPASLDGVFGVGASDPATGALCGFSARGAGLDVAFPGCGIAIASPAGEPLLAQGTSYAAPGAAAVLVALRAYRPDLTVDAAEQLVIDTAASHGGVVDARAAFIAAGLGSVVAEGERRADEAEATPREEPRTTPTPMPDPSPPAPPDTPGPQTRPPSRPPVARRPSRWPTPRARATRRGRVVTIRLLNRPRSAKAVVVLEVRRSEFGWSALPRQTSTRATARITLRRGVDAKRIRVRVWYAAQGARAASPKLTLSGATLRRR